MTQKDTKQTLTTTYNISQTATTAKNTLDEFKNALDPIIDTFVVNRRKKVLQNHNAYSAESLGILGELAKRGGKRLRASLVHFTYELLKNHPKNLHASATSKEDIVKICVAIELVHAYLLIIDDIMDMSPMRRGDLTAHKLWERYFEDHQFTQNKQHFGISEGMLSGMLGFHVAMQLINETGIPPITKIKIINSINDKVEVTTYGQTTDVMNTYMERVSERDVLDMLTWKTGVYTYENPMYTGALLADGDEETLAQISEYAIPAGIAFQIQDDILGMFGEVDEMGKSNMDDLMEGKHTLLIQYALQNGSESQTSVIRKHLGNRNLLPEEHKEVQQAIIDSGALEYSKQKAEELTKQAKSSLERNRQPYWDESALNYLLGIADYMIERSL